MATVTGNTAVGRHVTGEGAESLHLIYQHVQKEERVCEQNGVGFCKLKAHS